ncbi:MAG: tRNA (N6-threonylcarbamoyladenosine(37)-N6)-methyltransferase TrmO [Deltaproteobacteria bacterium]|nr:tRNA (N6-threonylcarbamoyladenosine(37)-N6)-methyltransferase TrmO [Deltaproteobacteria bacterium]
MTHSVRVIGVARTGLERGTHLPGQGVAARIVIDPAYEAALLGIEAATHLHVFAWLDGADRSVLQVQPRKLGGGVPPRGVFAVRSPVRPNPIGLSTTRLLGREGLALSLERLDVYDGTPIIDLKPYSPGWDQVLWASDPRRGRPWDLPVASRSAMWEREAGDAVGDQRHDPRVTEVIALFHRLVEARIDPRDPAVRYTVPALDLRVDALAVMAGARFGNGRLAYLPGSGAVGVDALAGSR